MAEFSTGAELAVSVSSSSLSDARDTIESELGDIEVGVSAVVEGNNRGGMAGGGSEGMSTLVRIENERWELDKYRNEYLEQLADSGMMGGGGGGDGGGVSALFAGRAGSAGAGAAAGAAGGVGLLGGALGAAGLGLGAGVIQGLLDPQHANQQTAEGVNMEGDTNVREQAIEDAEAGDDTEIGGLREPYKSMLEMPDLPSLSEQEWPDLPNLQNESWPDIPNLRDESWPQLPDLGQNFEWPDPPEFDFNPFDGQQQGNPNSTRSTGGPTRRGPNDQIQSVEPTVNIGGVDVEVPIDLQNVGNTVDDLQSDMESLDQDINDLERRISDAIEGLF